MLLKKHTKVSPRGTRAARRSLREKIRASFRAVTSTISSESRSVGRELARAVKRARASGDLGSRRDLSSLLVSVAAAFRGAATRLENEARLAMAESAELRKELPKLLEPTRATFGGTPTLIFEFGQPLTAQEAFAAALDITKEEATLPKMGERRAFLPRKSADELSAAATSSLVLLTRLRNRERRFMVWPGKRPRAVRAKRGGALIVCRGEQQKFYFPGTARMPAGTRIALPASALDA